MMTETKLNKADTVQEIVKYLNSATNDPADELIKMGEVLVEIGKALKGRSAHDARAIMTAVVAVS